MTGSAPRRCDSRAAQQLHHGPGRLIPSMDFHDDLADLGPVLLVKAGQDVLLALLRVHLQQVDPCDAVLTQKLREGPQLACHGLLLQIVPSHLLSEHVPHRRGAQGQQRGQGAGEYAESLQDVVSPPPGRRAESSGYMVEAFDRRG